MLKLFKFSSLIFLLLWSILKADNITVFDFTDDELKTLKVRKVKGKTKWTLGSNDNGNYIRAEA